MKFKNRVTQTSLAATLLLSVLLAHQSPAYAWKGRIVRETIENSGRSLRRIPMPKRVSPNTAKRQFNSCVKGYREGPSQYRLAVARNLCAHLLRSTR